MTIEELLYGMMLPSGNDAAQSLAVYLGHFLILAEGKSQN
jgi:D-alanyl-D-alanine carboxypeptidase